MSRFLIHLSGLLLVASASSCQGQPEVEVLTPQAFENKLRATSEKIILDVRTAGEYNKGHLQGAIMIDYYQRGFSAQLAALDKTKPVFVYCAGGVRSNASAMLLLRHGFKEVYDLGGGITAWVQSGKPLEK